MTDLTTLRKIAEAATPGPWHYIGIDFRGERSHSTKGAAGSVVAFAGYGPDGGMSNLNAAHIATFDPPTVLALIDEIEHLRRWKSEAKQVLDGLDELAKVADAPLGCSIIESAISELRRLQEQVEAVKDLHKPIPVYDECEHDAEHGCEPVELADYTACSESAIGWACETCCYDEGYGFENCPHAADHAGVSKSQSCPTMQIINEVVK